MFATPFAISSANGRSRCHLENEGWAAVSELPGDIQILDVPRILRVRLNEIKGGNRLSEIAPEPWMKWINGGAYVPLEAKAVTRPLGD
jgi:hypothetical protein